MDETNVNINWDELTAIKDTLGVLLAGTNDSLDQNQSVIEQLANKNIERLNKGIKEDIELYVIKVEKVFKHHKDKSGISNDLDDLAIWHDCTLQYSAIGMEAINTLQSRIGNLNAKITRALEKQQKD